MSGAKKNWIVFPLEWKFLSVMKHFALAYVVPAALTILVGIADHFTGREIDFSVFYLGALLMAAWMGRSRSAIPFAFVCAVVALVAETIDGLQFRNWLIHILNAGENLAVFLLVAILSARIKAQSLRDRQQSLTDPLTGIPNRRFFFERGEEMLRAATAPLTLAFIDVDNFKQLNDTKGHAVGDRLLIYAAQSVRDAFNAGEIVARLGGDEFVVLSSAPSRDVHGGLNSIFGHLLEHMKEQGWAVTFSVGAVTFETPLSSLDEMIRLADEQMYVVKKSGKNRVESSVFRAEGTLNSPTKSRAGG